VEVQVDGEDEVLCAFLDALRTGPRMARIEDVETEWSKEEKGFRDFRITF
jgi:acylphosphatase